MSFENKTAVIIGGANELGKRIIELLAENGANIVIADADETRAESLASSIGRNALSVPCDVSLQYEVDRVFLEAVRAFSKVDILINNAGVLGITPIGEGATDEWKRVMAVNADGVFMGMDAVAPSMRRAGGGAMVNASSTAGLQGYASMAAYVASKWAVRGMTKTAALELGPHGIRVNSVHPGPIATNMTQQIDPSITDSQAIGRFGRPEEVARLYLFLASDDSSYSTGAEFLVDGGQTLGPTGSLIED